MPRQRKKKKSRGNRNRGGRNKPPRQPPPRPPAPPSGHDTPAPNPDSNQPKRDGDNKFQEEQIVIARWEMRVSFAVGAFTFCLLVVSAWQGCTTNHQYGAMIAQNKLIDDQYKTMLAQNQLIERQVSVAEDAIDFAGEANAAAKRSADAAEKAVTDAEQSGKAERLLTEQAIEVAQAQVKLASDTAEKQLRAYVMVDSAIAYLVSPPLLALNAQLNAPIPGIVLKIKNSGNTPAANVEIHTQYDFRLTDVDADFPLNIGAEPHISRVACGPGGGFDHGLALKMTQQQLNDWRAGKLTLWLWGEIRYEDIFGKPHTTKYRFVSGGDATGPMDHPSYALFYASKGNSFD